MECIVLYHTDQSQYVTGMGTGWFRVSFGYSVCFMFEFDTHDVLCLVSSIVLIHSLFYVLCQDIV